MQLHPEHIHHIFNRGINRQRVYYNESHYLWFIEKLKNFDRSTDCSVLSYVLMPNHFHIMVYIESEANVSVIKNKYSTTLSSYTQKLNYSIHRTGSLFQKKSKCKVMEDPSYALTGFLYLHQNPLRGGLVSKMDQWPYSSYPDYAGYRNGTLCNFELTRELLILPSDIYEFRKLSNKTIPDWIWD